MMRPGSETPVPPPGDENDSGAAAASAAAILPSDARLRRCAFAVLRGRGIHEEADGKQVNEFFVRTFDVTLGRRSRGGGADVVISGDNMNISRQHARIRFNFEQGCWELVVLSKNGIMLNGVLLQPPLHQQQEEGEEGGEKKRNGGDGDGSGGGGGGSAANKPPAATAIARLASGDALSVGDRDFSFLLPSKRAAVLTTVGALEPGWLLGGASGEAGAAAAAAVGVGGGGGGGGVGVGGASPGPLPAAAAVTAAVTAAVPAAAAAAAAAPDAAVAAADAAVLPVPSSRPDTAQTWSVEREMEMEEDEKGGDKGKGKGGDDNSDNDDEKS